MNQKSTISFRAALLYWLKLGFISFGGPAGQISMMHSELVEQKKWISEKRFMHALNYCMVLPGPEAQQLATYLGWLMHGVWGGIIAGTFFILPSFVILCLLSYVYLAFGHLTFIQGVFNGIKPAVVAIVIFAAYRIGSKTLKNKFLWATTIIALVLLFLFENQFPAIILSAGLLGYFAAKIKPNLFVKQSGHDSTKADEKPKVVAVIDDETPTPDHAVFNKSKLIKHLMIGLVIGITTYSFLLVAFGKTHTLVHMAEFFTKAALLTFGGAYAVLPYVHEGSVSQYNWLSSLQMMDGLALGETTPGPLIMVVTFVGYLGGYTKEIIANHLYLSGLLAATVVTFFTFLPSFIFIFIGGPFIESTRNNLKFTGPLTAITAAVIAAILKLAFFFSENVIWPNGYLNTEWLSLAICLASAIMLIRFKMPIHYVIGGSALIGIISQYILI